MVLLVDENVPEFVTKFLRNREHTVHLVRERFASGTPDPIIAGQAIRMGAVVVTWNHKDFSPLAAESSLCLISFSCREDDGVENLAEHIEMIETVYARAKQEEKRVTFEIRKSGDLKILYPRAPRY